MLELHPLTILAIGMVVVLGMIIVLRVNAFLALIAAAMIVSVLAPGPLPERISRVADAFGATASKIGIVIALAAVIGQCMMSSGAADRIVRAFMQLLGQKKAPVALLGSGFVLSIPVFFDTVFYLLVPLARSLYKRTGQNFLLYVLAIVAGGAVTHTLVPPTPGPLVMAANLNIDVGVMIIVGILVGLPVSAVGLLFAGFLNRKMPIPMRALEIEPEHEPLHDDQLPGLLPSLLPVVLPVLLISSNTVMATLTDSRPELLDRIDQALGWPNFSSQLSQITALLGDANFALLLSTAVAMFVLKRKRSLTLARLGRTVETSLMSGGVIILITAGGGAFGAMLKAAEIGPAIQQLFVQSGGGSGLFMLGLGFIVACVLKVAQGSSTVAMITASAMLAAMNPTAQHLGFHPVYLATAIGSGSLVGSWMNDSGFWIVAKMSGLTEIEALKSWTPLLVVLGVTGLAVSVIASQLLPLV